LGESWVVIVARALSDRTRYRMLQEIRAAGEMTCGELHARFPLSQATISHHIKTLQQAGLLRVRAEGLFRHLSAESSRLSAFAAGVLVRGTIVVLPSSDHATGGVWLGDPIGWP